MLITALNIFAQMQSVPGHEQAVNDDTSYEVSKIPDSSNENNLYIEVSNNELKPGITYKNSYEADSLGPIHDPILEIIFEEDPYNHNMHITSDGDYYYTINGGNTASGQINKFTLEGTLVATFPILIDGRGLSYNKSDGYLYASSYLGNIYKITDLQNGSFETVFDYIMQNEQASFAISDDGTKFYDFYNGTLKIHDFATGTVLQEISGLSYGEGNFGGNAAVAVDPDYIYNCCQF
jgi:hypothetical protein